MIIKVRFKGESWRSSNGWHLTSDDGEKVWRVWCGMLLDVSEVCPGWCDAFSCPDLKVVGSSPWSGKADVLRLVLQGDDVVVGLTDYDGIPVIEHGYAQGVLHRGQNGHTPYANTVLAIRAFDEAWAKTPGFVTTEDLKSISKPDRWARPALNDLREAVQLRIARHRRKISQTRIAEQSKNPQMLTDNQFAKLFQSKLAEARKER